MRNLKARLAAACLCALVALGAGVEVSAQYRVNVYNPGNYSRTRQTMSNRAAVRAALKKKRLKRAAKARRAAARRNVN